MRNPRSYSKVGARKKAMSSRPTIGSKDINYYNGATLNVRYPKKFRNSDGVMVEEIVEEPFVDDSLSTTFAPSSIARGSRTRSTSNTIRKVSPKNQDFRPFLWRGPKPYSRYQMEVIARYSEVTNNFWYPAIDSSKISLIGDPLLFSTEPLVKKVVTFTDKQAHYLNFNEKLADQKIDVLTTLAEAKSTVTMVADAALSLFKFYRAVRKADIKTIKHLFGKKNIKRSVSRNWKNKTAESRWLELQYGWQPFAADIRTAFEELQKDTRPPAPIIKVVSSTLLSADTYVNVDKYDSYDFFGVLKTSCYYTVTSEGIRDAAKWNLGNNPLLTGWELVPYSFVIDWFLPIGDFLTQFSSSQGLEFISGTTVSHIKFEGFTSIERLVYGSGKSLTIKSREHHKMFSTNREVNYTTPIGLPVFSGGLSVGRALNALALISQRR